MGDNLELKIVFAAIDKFSGAAKGMNKESGRLAKALKEAREEFKKLEKNSSLIESFRSTNKSLGIANNDLKVARERVAAMAKAMEAAGVPSERMQRDFKHATTEARNLAGNVNRLMEKKQRLRHELGAVGIDTKKLAEAQRSLKDQMAAATQKVTEQDDALHSYNKKMQRMRALRADIDAARQRSGALMAKGAAITAAGAAVALPVAKVTKDFADFETAMLGVAKQVEGARDDNGQVTQTYWEMADAIKAMSERLPGSAIDIAKIVEGGARMGIQGKDNLLKYAEATAIMAQAFELPVDQIGKDMGTVAQLYKIPIANIKELGDTLNWLDDQTLAQGADIIEVMKRVNGVTQMASMSYKEAAALGSTFLSLGASSEVAATATNAMVRELSTANMQSKRFREGLAMLGLDGGAIQKGMSTNATGTIIQVLEKIKSLSGDKQLEAATRLFGKEYGDDAAKLAENLEKYREALRLVNDEKAKGSTDRELISWQNTLAASTENTQNTFNNLSTDLGKFMKGTAVDALQTTMSMVQAVRDWAKENPGLAGSLMTVVKWLAITLSGIGLLMAGFGAIIVPMAIMKASMVALGWSGSAAFGRVGGAIKTLARLLAMTPIGRTIALIAAGAYLIYENWDWLKTKFTEIIEWIFEKIDKFMKLMKEIAAFSLFGQSASPAAGPAVSPALTPVIAPAAKRPPSGNSIFNINVNGTAGATPAELAAQIRREMEAAQREKAARERSSLRDQE